MNYERLCLFWIGNILWAVITAVVIEDRGTSILVSCGFVPSWYAYCKVIGT